MNISRELNLDALRAVAKDLDDILGAVRDPGQVGFTGDATFRGKLANLAGQKASTTHNISDLRAALKRARQQKMKAYTLGGQPAATSEIYRMLGISNYGYFLQDYLPEVETRANRITLHQQDADTGSAASVVSEGSDKQLRTITHRGIDHILQKVAISIVYSEEARTFLGQRLFDFLELQLLLAVEEGISNYLLNALTGAAVAFNPAPYAASVIAANYIDVLNLMQQQEDEQGLYETRATRSEVDLAIIDPTYYQRLLVLKGSTNYPVRLYGSYSEACPNIESVVWQPDLGNFGFVARSAEFPVVTTGEVLVYNDRIVEAGKENNTYRMTLDFFLVCAYTRRVNNTTGYARFADIPATIGIINQP